MPNESKIIHIVPKDSLPLTAIQNRHMILTHLVEKYDAYARFFREAEGYKILDNSLIELGGAVSIDRVCDAAEQVSADEIILPDVFRNGVDTVKGVKDALKYIGHRYKNNPPFSLMAVCQGRSISEWEQCFRALNHMTAIDVIGIPKVCAIMHAQGRPYFEKFWQKTRKDIHLLGLWYSWAELEQYVNWDKIRSLDTSLAAWHIARKVHVGMPRPDGHTINLETEVISQGDFAQYQNSLRRVYSWFQ